MDLNPRADLKYMIYCERQIFLWPLESDCIEFIFFFKYYIKYLRIYKIFKIFGDKMI